MMKRHCCDENTCCSASDCDDEDVCDCSCIRCTATYKELCASEHEVTIKSSDKKEF